MNSPILSPMGQEDQIIAQALMLLENRLRTPGEKINNPKNTIDYLKLKVSMLEHEVFGVLFLDVKLCLIHDELMFRGTLASSSVYPREILKEALKHNANGVVIYHNHPSGEVTPSTADDNLTRDLKKMLGLIDVSLVDHIIIGGMGYFSYRNEGSLL